MSQGRRNRVRILERSELVKSLLAILAALLLTVPCFAGEETRGHQAGAVTAEGPDQTEEKEEETVADFIFHHVSDSNTIEIDIPLNRGKNPVIHLPVIRVPLKEGACPTDPRQSASLAKGCLDLSITKHTVMMWLAAVLLVVGALL